MSHTNDDGPPAPPADFAGMVVYEIVDVEAFAAALRPVIERNTATQNDAPAERSGDGWHGDIGGACPVQGYGEVDGLPWYFRARGECWSFQVAAAPEGDPVDVDDVDQPPGAWVTGGDADGGGGEFAGSWMGRAESWRHVEESVAAWRAWRSARTPSTDAGASGVGAP